MLSGQLGEEAQLVGVLRPESDKGGLLYFPLRSWSMICAGRSFVDFYVALRYVNIKSPTHTQNGTTRSDSANISSAGP